jgi:hypothetical protein
MNKFSDMIAFLASTDDKFRQVIAVDASLEIFQRAWVIAEIAQCHSLGMPQDLKLRDAATLEHNLKDREQIDIEKMQATRSEDVREILATIPDRPAFNRHLSRVIFDTKEGLVASWSCLDAAQKMERIGRTLRLAHLSMRSGAAAVAQAGSDENV